MFSTLTFSLLFGLANAHLAAWHRGMYCLDGSDGSVDLNTAAPVTPLYQLSKNDWWFHHINKCDEFPPAPGDFLDLPAGGQFQVEIASNRAKTTLSYSGRDISDWPDGAHYPDNYNVPTCITSPNMHTQNQTMAAGTAFAISYQSDIKQVTPENLVVFSVRYHTPWKRLTSYDVPSAMPACPQEGCICAWGWIPNGCGQPNMYHQAFRCRVTNAQSTTPLATPKPPVWCEGQPDKCVKGAKQMLYWHQADGNNIVVDGFDLAGQQKSPGYNMKTGFADGAQNDIFAGASNNGRSDSNVKMASSPGAPAPGPVASGSQQSNGGSAAPTSSSTPVPSKSATPDHSPTCRSRKNKRSVVGPHETQKRDLHKNRLNAKSW
ncbi:hypothetical protein P691DRAFT_733026 [Macrolepiota fuliginosa MF-IS2]|uniref:Uncharacterized protein n=1 Tax=Macrolepiota fuliginosa MF-IS2 TaxID=1400762 RepID=A0A9P5X826_9AGAR|nr:hypothetical protein P691DRAFT_733026 [Macrolepiota fuliginosa MF-IS2]